MNYVRQLQSQLKDVVDDVFDEFCENGKSIDFSLGKFTDISEDRYKDLLDNDKHETSEVECVEERIFMECPSCDNCNWFDDYFNDSNCQCIGIKLVDGKAYAVVYNGNADAGGDVWEQPIWGISPDIAAMIIDINNQNED